MCDGPAPTAEDALPVCTLLLHKHRRQAEAFP